MRENKRLNKIINYRILVILVFILTLLIMRGNESKFLTYSEGANMLDMRFGYEIDDVYQMFRILGTEGRSLYIRLLCIDFLFIVSFALVQNYLLKRIMGKAVLNSKWHFLLSLSYLRGLFDVVENSLILIMLINFPIEFLRLVKASSFATSLKFIFLGLWLIAIPISFFVRKHMENNTLKRTY